MEESETTLQKNQSQSFDEASFERDKFINEFWDLFENSGVEVAAKYFKKEVNGNLAVTQLLVPYLVEAGYNRNIDMLEAVKAMQTIELEDDDDAVGTTDDGGVVPADSSDPAVVTQDEDESATGRDADTEAESKQ